MSCLKLAQVSNDMTLPYKVKNIGCLSFFLSPSPSPPFLSCDYIMSIIYFDHLIKEVTTISTSHYSYTQTQQVDSLEYKVLSHKRERERGGWEGKGHTYTLCRHEKDVQTHYNFKRTNMCHYKLNYNYNYPQLYGNKRGHL